MYNISLYNNVILSIWRNHFSCDILFFRRILKYERRKKRKRKRQKTGKKRKPNKGRMKPGHSGKSRFAWKKKRNKLAENRKLKRRRHRNGRKRSWIRRHDGLPEVAAAAGKARDPAVAARGQRVQPEREAAEQRPARRDPERPTQLILPRWEPKSRITPRLMHRRRSWGIPPLFMMSNCCRTELCVIYVNASRLVSRGSMKRCWEPLKSQRLIQKTRQDVFHPGSL